MKAQDIFSKLWVRAKRYSCYFLSCPIAIIIMLISPVVKIRFIRLISDRIGHFALNTELMLCKLDSIHNDRNIVRLYYTCDSSVPICNEQLYLMWKRIIPIIPFPTLSDQINSILLFFLGRKYANDPAKCFERHLGLQDNQFLLEKNKPHLSFTEVEQIQGRHLIQSLGIPNSSRYVCLLVRDSNYLNTYLPGQDWSHHDIRNASVANYSKAALYLAELGYYVVRVGKYVKNKFAVSHPQIIDYANHPLRSDFLDIYLSAHCDFFISSTTGLDSVPQLFRRPVLLTNVAPFYGQLQYWYPCILFIPKMLAYKETKQFLSFYEVGHLEGKHKNILQYLDVMGLELLENTADEILDAVKEMVSLVSGHLMTEDDLKLQQEFRESVPLSFIADKQCFQPEQFKIYIGKKFLYHWKLTRYEHIKYL